MVPVRVGHQHAGREARRRGLLDLALPDQLEQPDGHRPIRLAIAAGQGEQQPSGEDDAKRVYGAPFHKIPQKSYHLLVMRSGVTQEAKAPRVSIGD